MAYPLRTYPTLRFAVVFLLCCTGGNGLVVKTSVGEDVVLQCEAGKNTDATDLSLHWSRTDSPPNEYVHFRRYGKDDMKGQTPTYKGRTSIFKDELKNGNVSLKLSSVKQSDAGTYKCFLPDLSQGEELILIVGRGITGNESTTEAPSDSPPPQVREAEVTNSVPPAGPFPWWGGVIIGVVVVVIIQS